MMIHSRRLFTLASVLLVFAFGCPEAEDAVEDPQNDAEPEPGPHPQDCQPWGEDPLDWDEETGFGLSFADVVGEIETDGTVELEWKSDGETELEWDLKIDEDAGTLESMEPHDEAGDEVECPEKRLAFAASLELETGDAWLDEEWPVELHWPSEFREEVETDVENRPAIAVSGDDRAPDAIDGDLDLGDLDLEIEPRPDEDVLVLDGTIAPEGSTVETDGFVGSIGLETEREENGAVSFSTHEICEWHPTDN